ncbi:hypothetical protein Dimus_001658, partial [Dionaea muscipula]
MKKMKKRGDDVRKSYSDEDDEEPLCLSLEALCFVSDVNSELMKTMRKLFAFSLELMKTMRRLFAFLWKLFAVSDEKATPASGINLDKT